MPDELLPYYNRELAFIRRMGAQFAAAYPKIAGRLRLGTESSEDPHVSRLIEAFAYLNARIRHKLDDDFPEITEALLGILYPHYLNPIPSMAIARFALDRSQGALAAGYSIERGSMLETEPVGGEPCRFRTCYPVRVWPIELISGVFAGRPFEAPLTPRSSETQAVVRLSLRCYSGEMKFSQLEADHLRFFLKGQSQHIYELYELIFNNTLEVVLAESPNDREPVRLEPSCIKPVGFERDENVLPQLAQSFPGYRLLTEFFAFPEKFLFFDLEGLDRGALKRFGGKLEIFFYLDRTSNDLEQNVDTETFQLGATPIVNLFEQRAEPIELSQRELEYHVVPDARRPMATEVYTIDRVAGVSPDGEIVEHQPFYSFKHGVDADQQRTFWFANRAQADRSDTKVDEGTEVTISVVDLDFDPAGENKWTLDVETTCLNRDLPHRLPFGGGQPRLQLAKGGGPLGRVECLTPPSATLRPALGQGTRWRLVSHLGLGHLSISGREQGADALREILRLYDYNESAETRNMIEGLVDVSCRRAVGRVGDAGSVCQGVEVTLTFDESRFTGSGIYLFASVLEHFLGLYSSINSFTQTIAKIEDREGALKRWPPRSGEKTIL